MFSSAADSPAWHNLRDHTQHAPTIGILPCAGRNDQLVRYALAGTTAPLAVADYSYDTLPAPMRELVPTHDDLATAVADTLNDLDPHIQESRRRAQGHGTATTHAR